MGLKFFGRHCKYERKTKRNDAKQQKKFANYLYTTRESNAISDLTSQTIDALRLPISFASLSSFRMPQSRSSFLPCSRTIYTCMRDLFYCRSFIFEFLNAVLKKVMTKSPNFNGRTTAAKWSSEPSQKLRSIKQRLVCLCAMRIFSHIVRFDLAMCSVLFLFWLPFNVMLPLVLGHFLFRWFYLFNCLRTWCYFVVVRFFCFLKSIFLWFFVFIAIMHSWAIDRRITFNK